MLSLDPGFRGAGVSPAFLHYVASSRNRRRDAGAIKSAALNFLSEMRAGLSSRMIPAGNLYVQQYVS
jgi:hypothetical protein